jgi:hypothetical protein
LYLGSIIPGVSEKIIWYSFSVNIPLMRWRVVCTLGDTIASFSSINALRSVLLPALGRPKIFTNPDFMNNMPEGAHFGQKRIEEVVSPLPVEVATVSENLKKPSTVADGFSCCEGEDRTPDLWVMRTTTTFVASIRQLTNRICWSGLSLYPSTLL